MVGTFDGATEKLYVNGVLQYTGLLSKTVKYVSDQPLTMGTWYYGGTNYFNGLIDDVRVYNYARAPKQITEDMLARQSGSGGGNAGFNSRILEI